jgi:hypothetical protein
MRAWRRIFIERENSLEYFQSHYKIMFEYIPKFNNLSDIEYSDYRNEEEREFMTALNARAAEWKLFGMYEDDWIMFYDGEVLSLGVYIYSFRDLRIDLTETSLLLGEDETHQYVTKLNSNAQGVIEYNKTDYTTAQLAEIAADWITHELSRKIELREWITDSYHHKNWVLTDANRVITISDSKGKFRRDDLGEPTKVTVVYSGEKNVPVDE